MKEIKEGFKNLKDNNIFFSVLSFLFPIIVLLIVLFIKGIGFDGERLAIGDMQAQYSHMMIYFKHILNGTESIFYSFTKGLGGDMFSTITYYMLSPINLVLALFDDANIMQGIYVIILIKFGLCSFTMYTYLNYKNKDKKLMAFVFATCYALMAYNINNYFCIMWFDAIYMAPLIMMGLEKLIFEKNVTQYMICLFYTIMVNYYMGYMICIYCVLYFVYLLVVNFKAKDKKKIFDAIKRFIFASLFAGLAACIVYLPSILEILKANRSSLTPDQTNITGTINRLFIGSYGYDTFLSYHNPNIYCGCIVVALFITYFFNKRHKDKEKYATAAMLVIFILSIFIPFLNYIWHGFSYPIGYNFRFTYLLCSFLITTAYVEVTDYARIDKLSRNALYVFAFLLGVYSFAYNDSKFTWLSIGLIILYAIFLNVKKNFKYFVLSALIIIELCVNTYECLIPADNLTRYDEFYNNICSKFEDGTYRVAGTTYYGTNELTACYKGSTKGFYSTMNENIALLYGKVGFSGGVNFYEDSVYAPPIISSLLGVKYVYSDMPLLIYDLYTTVETTKSNIETSYIDEDYIYQNNEALGLGYMIYNYDNNYEGDAFAYQNNIIKNFSGIDDDVLRYMPLGTYEYTESAMEEISTSKYIYFQIVNPDIKQIIINNSVYEGYEAYKIYGIENQIDSNIIEIVALDEYGNSVDGVYVYYLVYENYMNAINNLKLHQLENVTIDGNTITGNINVGSDGTLVLSIPYEKGWTLYVDGKKTEITQVYDMFMGTDLSIGEHTIKLVYQTSSFGLSLTISIIFFIVSIIYILYNRKNKFILNLISKIKNR